MRKNMSKTDKTIRLLLAAVLITLNATHTISGTWGIASLVIAGIFIITSLAGTCPLYNAIGINTCKKTR